MKKYSLRQLVTLAAALSLVLFMSVSFASAQTYSAPGSAFPNGNATKPLSLSAEYQEKFGNFWANRLSATTQLCIGVNCITAWPSATYACTTEKRQIIDVAPYSSYGDLCSDKLTAASRAAGWIALGSDTCVEDTGQCTQDSEGTLCVYQRTLCNGVPVSTALPNTTFSAEASSGFFNP